MRNLRPELIETVKMPPPADERVAYKDRTNSSNLMQEVKINLADYGGVDLESSVGKLIIESNESLQTPEKDDDDDEAEDEEEVRRNWARKQSGRSSSIASSSSSTNSPASSSNSMSAPTLPLLRTASRRRQSGKAIRSQGIFLDLGNKCGKCQNHNVERSKKGHARDCPFKKCNCLKCCLLDARSDILQVISGKETKLKGTKKDPNCGFCQNHGVKILRKGHVRSCGFGQERHFKLDNCFDCEVHYIRNEVNRLQIKMRRAMKEDRTLSEEQRKTAREAITRDEVEKVCEMARLARLKRDVVLKSQQVAAGPSEPPPKRRAIQQHRHNPYQRPQQFKQEPQIKLPRGHHTAAGVWRPWSHHHQHNSNHHNHLNHHHHNNHEQAHQIQQQHHHRSTQVVDCTMQHQQFGCGGSGGAVAINSLANLFGGHRNAPTASSGQPPMQPMDLCGTGQLQSITNVAITSEHNELDLNIVSPPQLISQHQQQQQQPQQQQQQSQPSPQDQALTLLPNREQQLFNALLFSLMFQLPVQNQSAD